MIRIDEMYSGVMASWIRRSKPNLRLLYCDPFGRSDPASIQVNTPKSTNTDYVLMFDQEPIDYDLHQQTFDQVRYINNDDIHYCSNNKQIGHIVTSEKHSSQVEELGELYGWKSHYYFFHGWAALDWYRGYNRSYLITEPEERVITKTFIMPNRIVGGLRSHRLEMLYYIFKLGLMNNYISCPDICPAEGESVKDLLLTVALMREDAVEVFDSAALPLNMPNEQGHPMHSCWLSLFDESAECLLYLVTETVASGRRQHLTEKIFKPICLRMPFILLGTAGSLEYLRSYGFKTFATVWDESYDTIEDDDLRIAAIAELLKNIDQLPAAAKQDLFRQCADIIEHNYHHFYSGAFEEILWQELQSMLAEF